MVTSTFSLHGKSVTMHTSVPNCRTRDTLKVGHNDHILCLYGIF